MRWAGIGGRFEALLLEAEEALGQPVELGPDLLDHRPLLRQLVGQFLDRFRLMRDRLLKPGDTFAVIAHGFSLGQPFVFQAIPYHIHMIDKAWRYGNIAFRLEVRKSRWTLPIELGRVDELSIF